jgi:peptidoglycan/LPS O-acetylase OafA/YrhL
MDVLGHTWSLNLEAQFYLAWPLVLLPALKYGGTTRLGRVIGAGICASAVLRVALWVACQPAAATGLAVRADSLLAGGLVAALASVNRLPTARLAWRAAGWLSGLLLIVLGLTAHTGAAWLHLGGYTVAAAAAAVLIAALVQSPAGPASRVLAAPPLVWTGRISYGLYLWHFPLLSIAPKLIHGVWPATRHVPGFDGASACALAFAAALLSYYAVERPFLRWRDALGRRRRPEVSFPLAQVGN